MASRQPNEPLPDVNDYEGILAEIRYWQTRIGEGHPESPWEVGGQASSSFPLRFAKWSSCSANSSQAKPYDPYSSWPSQWYSLGWTSH